MELEMRTRLPHALRAAAIALSILVACSAARVVAADVQTPEQVVRAYLTALKAEDYASAYGLLTPDMTRSQDKDTWVREQTIIMKLGEAQINSFEVFPAKVDGDKAIVPNLLKSKDKYLNQTGADEYELYRLVRTPDQTWKIERQELVETDKVSKWFPASVQVR
jgi:hypothetical protein